ncbi:thiosulfate transporter TsuA-like [Diadema antillarum]|uniref:thiosulfate transporter TsuA-like n=1 Tax=Diadema antillarum TaxID=105358 RepID=UPI003A892C1B
MTSVHQVLLPGEADSGDAPIEVLGSGDTYRSLTNTPSATSRQESAATMPQPQRSVDERHFTDVSQTDANERGLHSARATSLASPKIPVEYVASSAPAAEQDLEKGGDPIGDNMHRKVAGRTEEKVPSESKEYQAGKNGETKWTDDKAVILTDNKEWRTERTGLGQGAKALAKLFGCFLCGMIFGIAAEKGRVFETATIRGQFIYQRFIMMKMFLSAAGTSCLCLALLSVIPATRHKFEAARTAYVSCLTQKGVITVIIGGAILGAGMAISGSCPGMVLVQIGAWLSNGGGAVTFLGCIVAVFVYALLEPCMTRLMAPAKPYDKYLADSFVDKWKVHFAFLAATMGVLMGLVVITIEILKPWTTDLANPNVIGSWFFENLAWPPYVSGIMIGSLQIPLILLMSDTIGGSSSYCTLCAQVLVTRRMEEWLPYLARFKRGSENWWQVSYVLGAVVGACVSAAASRSLGSVPGVSLASSFIGGFLLIFGSRLASGCTSGHGLSGMAVLSLLSFLAVAAMFAGGTAIGFIFWAVCNSSVLDYYTF